MHARVRRALAAATLFLLAGCYDIGAPVIDLRDAHALPWMVGEWEFPHGREVVVFQGNHPNEYRYRDVTAQRVSTGTFRAVPLGGEIYLVQTIGEDGDVAALFFRRHPDGSIGELKVNKAVFDLAKRFGVALDDLDDGVLILDGSAAAVRAFLLAHRPAHFR